MQQQIFTLLSILVLIPCLFSSFSVQEENSLSYVENKIINKITNLLLFQLEARSVDLSIPILQNIAPTTAYSPNTDLSSSTFVCGTPSKFFDRIKLVHLEYTTGYVRDSNGNTIGHWSPSDRCYINIISQTGCVYPMGTYYTNCASNSLLTLLPTKTMFYHLSLISTLKSDIIQMLLHEKKMFILAQDLETIVIWGRETGIDAQVFKYKVEAYKLELKSLQNIFDGIVKRYRDALLQYASQFNIDYELVEHSSNSFSKLKSFITNGRYTYNNTTFSSVAVSSSCVEILKKEMISEGVNGKRFDLLGAYCGAIEFLDRHNSIVSKMLDIVEKKFVLSDQLVTEQLVSEFILGEAVVKESEFDFINEFSVVGQYSSNTNPQFSINFEYSLSGVLNETWRMIFSPNSMEALIVDPVLKSNPASVFHFDSQLQAKTFDVMALINSASWVKDSTLENDYKEILTNLRTSKTKSIQRTPLNGVQQSIPNNWESTSRLRTTSTTTYNCEKGKYGPNCKVCTPGTYSPGDGLLYVCNNGPINQVTYTRSGETSENCVFQCKDGKKFRVGNTCQSIPIGFYSKDFGGEELAPCSMIQNQFGILDEGLQHDNLVIISSGSHGSASSCQVAMRHFLSIPYNWNLGSNSFTMSMNLKLTDFSQFNFVLKNYLIGYGIVSFADWVFQMNIDTFTPTSTFKSIYMQLKNVNSTETFLISTSFSYDTDWHQFTLQYDQPNKVLTLFRDGNLIGACYFSMSDRSSSSLILGGFVDLVNSKVMYFPGMIANFKVYNSTLGNELLIEKYFDQLPCSQDSSVMFGNGKCLSLSCPNSKMIQEPSTSSCSCPFGRYFNADTQNCQACPYDSTTGSLLPRTSLKDCQCLPDYIYSEKYGECVLAKSSLSPPAANFQFSNSLGSYKELENSILSQMYYPVGEMELSFNPIEMENDFLTNMTSSLSEVYMYKVKLILNNTNVVWSYSMKEQDLREFRYVANRTGDFDLIMSTDCDSHRAGLMSKISFHIRERDLQPLIKPKPSDSKFDSPFQVRILQPYKTKQSIVILCFGREEFNLTCVEYDDRKLYVFAPPAFVKTFSYGPYFQRLPGPIISYFYERSYSEAQLNYIENQKTWNVKLAKKQEILKENEEKKKASVLYQVFNPFIEWFLTYPNYLWFPIVSCLLVVIYVVILLVIRIFIARRINRKRKEKIKQYLKEKKNMEEYLKNFLPPPLREGFDNEEDEEKDSRDETDSNESSNDDSEDETNSSDYEDDESDDDDNDDDSDNSQNSSGSEHGRKGKNGNKRVSMVDHHHNRTNDISTRKNPNPTKPPKVVSTRFKEDSLNDDVDIQLQNIGASRNRNLRNKIIQKPLPTTPSTSQKTPIANNSTSNNRKTSVKPLPKPLPKKEPQGPKYLMCGECGGIARFWCKRCSKYMCIQCNLKDNSQLHESCKSKVMVCDYCLQPKSELREVFLKGNSQMKMYACKMCLEDLYEQRKVNRVGGVIKRCTKCMDEEISKNQPEKKMCDNCIYFN